MCVKTPFIDVFLKKKEKKHINTTKDSFTKTFCFASKYKLQIVTHLLPALLVVPSIICTIIVINSVPTHMNGF